MKHDKSIQGKYLKNNREKKTHKHKSKNGNLQVNSKNNNKQTKQDAIFTKNQCQQIRVGWDPAWNRNHRKNQPYEY